MFSSNCPMVLSSSHWPLDLVLKTNVILTAQSSKYPKTTFHLTALHLFKQFCTIPTLLILRYL